ncbi:MAG: hypothetical protein IPN07_07605 [Dehalococcoidia bacterium]|nr:hypothetical protein [Dehalococcoidia bacterium]
MVRDVMGLRFIRVQRLRRVLGVKKMRNWANSSGRRGLALGLVAVAAVGVVAWATTMADFEPSSEPPTPTPAALRDAPMIEEGRRAVAAHDSNLQRFVDAVEQANIDGVLSFFAWNPATCESIIVRSVDECARREIPKGTVLEFFAPNFYEGAGLTREELREAIGYDLRGRNPRLSMVADRTDGRLVLLFMLDPQPGRTFPGGEPAGGPPTVAIWFATTDAKPAQIATYDHRHQGSPPLEFLRYEQYVGTFDYTVVGVTLEFAALESTFHEKNEAERRTP